MAINFGNTIMEGGIEPSTVVQNPVQDNSSAVLGEALQGPAKTLGAIAGSIWQKKEVSAADRILTQYDNDLLDIADAVDQGEYDSNEAMIRARNIHRQYLSNSPDLRDDFYKVWTNFATSNGLGHVVIEGTQQQQMQEAKIKAAFDAGYPSVEAYDLSLARANEVKAVTDELTYVTSQNGVVTESLKQRGLKAVLGVADSAYSSAQNQITQAMQQMNADPANRAAIAQATITSLKQQSSGISATALGADAAFVTKPIDDLLTTFQEYAAGTVETSTLEAQIKFAGLQYSYMYATDPRTASVVANASFFKELGIDPAFVANKLFDDRFIQTMKDVQAGKMVPGANDDVGYYFQTMTDILGADVNDAQSVEELKTLAAGAGDSAYTGERSVTDGAMGYKSLVNWLGSPETSAFIDKHGPIPFKQSEGIVEALSSNYANELVPAIQKYWESVPVVSPGSADNPGVQNIPMNELLDVIWNGSAVEFVPKQQWADNPRIQALARDTNTGSNSIGIPLNSLINAEVNARKGTSSEVDGKTVWENKFASSLFGLGQGGEPLDAEQKPIAERVSAELDKANAPGLDAFAVDEIAYEESSVFKQPETAQLPPLDPAYTNVDGVDYNSYLPSIRAAESGGNDNVRNPTSTATGRYQFLKGTWNDLVNRYPNSGLTYDGRTDPQQNEAAIRLFTAENARYLAARGVPLNNGNLYAAHFLGAGDAGKVLNAPDDALVSQYVPSSVVSANSFLRGKTVSWFKNWVARKGNG